MIRFHILHIQLIKNKTNRKLTENETDEVGIFKYIIKVSGKEIGIIKEELFNHNYFNIIEEQINEIQKKKILSNPYSNLGAITDSMQRPRNKKENYEKKCFGYR